MHIPRRTFLISGGASGLGLATARGLHARGAAVAILDSSEEAGEAVVAELGPERARFFETDVSDETSVGDAVKGVVEWAKSTDFELGGVVAAAGVGLPGKIVDRNNEPLSLSSVNTVFGINVRGTVDLIRQTVPHLVKTSPGNPDGEQGVLILVSSSAAFEGQQGQVAYSASKGAVASMTLPLARDLAQYGIRAVAIAPGWFETKMTSLMNEKTKKSLERVMEFPKRPGDPEEFARLVVEVVENGMLNGTVIRLDGALRMPSRL
ncbi:hypothetical protein BDY21DRAFT_363039 [Lineolata rhizophorae]|uniref:Ketoreductase domain-containing protein n=1 Tax=Lineolata rhizophorae TaxID=578093 RepID=A0A6A6P229_9PEZI|nr:hypothetical protein BDY21DRAFT_363039 [Lineolata rhizophorae]